ncbi:MAG: biopolymer transporter ExbD [bacterium]
MAFNRLKRVQEEAQELNVIPVMNLFMVLIPFLLLGATFFHIGVIPTSTPTLSPSDSDVPKTPTTVAVNLEVTPDAIKISSSSVSLDEDQLNALAAEWPKKNNEYQVLELQKALVAIKDKYPDSNTLTVLPYEELNYQDLVKILDVTRVRQIGVDEKGEPKMQDLFPVTIFSRFVPPELEGENAAIDDQAAEMEIGDEEVTE